MNYWEVFGSSALAIAVLMLGTWLVSVVLKNASIVDIVWGAGFVLVAWVSYAVGEGTESRRLLLACMVTLWGGRLAIYLWIRNHGKGEDPRYVAMRKKRGDKFALQSLWVVFGLQGVLMWIVSLPVQVGSVADQPTSLGPVEIVGIILYTAGVYFESMGDMQLSHFKADPNNADKVMDQGLWRYTRHPNYFGDFCVWWGIWIVAAATGVGIYAIVGPIVMTFFLLRVSGVAMLERSIGKRRPGYDDYIARTNAFFPGPPKPSA
jgi:steroid 5-alpha reductase family enzyme